MARGTPNTSRIHAKNFPHHSANERFAEAIPAIQEQGMNALHVDSYEVLLFRKMMSSRSCTCRETQNVQPEVDEGLHGEFVQPTVQTPADDIDTITLAWNPSLFGSANDHPNDFADESDPEDYDFDDAPTSPNGVLTSTIDSTPACGICYRTGFLPGFEQYGQQRQLFTSLDIADSDGYTVDRTAAPHTLNRLTRDGRVSFELRVPKYFKQAVYSVRNGYEILNDVIYLADNPITMADLQANAGKTLLVSVGASKFTHLQVVFDLGADPIRANIAQLSKMTDWTSFEAIGTLNVVTNTDLSDVTVGSVIVVPSRNFGLRITDVPYLMPASGHSLDWAVSTRFMQPQEALRNIAKNVKIF